LRRIGYRDQETGKRYEFLTNHFRLSAKTIADIYKERWQIELFFKEIKQNLRIKTFVGNSENAVLIQIYTALTVYLLLAYQKFLSRLGLSVQQLFQLIQLNLLGTASLEEMLSPRRRKTNNSRYLSLLDLAA
jgi:IS4 transposase